MILRGSSTLWGVSKCGVVECGLCCNTLVGISPWMGAFVQWIEWICIDGTGVGGSTLLSPGQIIHM